MLRKIFLIAVLIGLTIYSCEKDPTSIDEQAEVKLNGVFILNEGGFGHSNGSLSFYSAEDSKIQNSIFEKVNNRSLGDVVQSMTIIDTLGFIVVNNSNTIEVISINSWKSIRTINMPTGTSPRYLADGSNDKAYVTNLYANNVSVLDLSNYEISSSIDVGSNPEEIVIADGKAYVANSGFGYGNTVSVIDLSSNQVTRTISVGDNPGSIKIATDKTIHVLCTGRWGDWTNPADLGTDGGVYEIDPVSLTITDSLIVSGHPSKLNLDGNNKGYFINGSSIVSFSTDTYQIINDTLITGYYYGLNLDPLTERLFVMDAKDYSQNGSVSIFDLDGKLIDTFDVGIIPGNATFVYKEE